MQEKNPRNVYLVCQFLRSLFLSPSPTLMDDRYKFASNRTITFYHRCNNILQRQIKRRKIIERNERTYFNLFPNSDANSLRPLKMR